MSNCLGGGIKVVSKEGELLRMGSRLRITVLVLLGQLGSSRNQRHQEVGISGLRRSHSRAHKWRSTIISTINKNTYYRGS